MLNSMGEYIEVFPDGSQLIDGTMYVNAQEFVTTNPLPFGFWVQSPEAEGAVVVESERP